ncbi:nucleotidyltransferase domain-containing protein [Pseudalkalibacillus berkeleyi]|uniref:nucleotidyltransferase domain-containing protein n=1 Tax=Pseudalkalibacillus berkeleyi TaxID=1069813 RepID=UPI002E30FEFD|nr:nucleotidyltransferase domain-containing protein [Pseudalkalibacillus berkeleyi]
MNRLDSYIAAKDLINVEFRDCQGAILAGSVVRKEETSTSDLDIVIFDNQLKSSYRESFIYKGWPVEIFAHSLSSYQAYFKMDCERAIPSLPRMIFEGRIIKDEGILAPIRKEAKLLLDKGPVTWTKATINTKRYFITDLIDDLLGSNNRNEQIFIVNTLADRLHEFVLRTNGKWIGSSKWIYRALRSYDEHFTNSFIDALKPSIKEENFAKSSTWLI